jgi:type II secretory pathway pseudopilin PulG
MTRPVSTDQQSGFSYIDVLIATVILMVGILTMAAALTVAFVTTTAGENQLRAKAVAMSVLENVMSARNVSIGGSAHTFGSIQHVGQGGVFVVGKRPAYLDAGADGLFGTGDDGGEIASGLQREIIITDVDNPLRPFPANPITERRITVIVYYRDRAFERSESVSTSVTNY